MGKNFYHSRWGLRFPDGSDKWFSWNKTARVYSMYFKTKRRAERVMRDIGGTLILEKLFYHNGKRYVKKYEVIMRKPFNPDSKYVFKDE